MTDLGSTLFFKGKFEVRAKSEEKDLLWDLVLKIRDWMTHKWRKSGENIPYNTPLWTSWKFGSNFSSDSGMVHFKSVYHKNDKKIEFWACKIIESWPSKNGYTPREWTTEIGFQQLDKDMASISIVIYYSDRPGFIALCEPDPDGSVPNIIRKYVKDSSVECTIDGYQLDLKAKHLIPGDFPDFWNVVCNEARDIPVIYISPRKTDISEDAGEILLNPQKLMNILGPNALIYYADDVDFSREMTQLCNPESYGCYSGGIRIYAPHPHTKDVGDSYRHRYISARSIVEIGDGIYNIIRRALAQDVHFYDKMFRLEDCKQLNDCVKAEKRNQEYREELEKELLGSAIEKEIKLQEELKKINGERTQWENEKEEYRTTIKELRAELHQSKAREDAYRDEALLSIDRKKALASVRTISKYPQTPEDIGKYFIVHFADRIDFTEKGLASLKDCTTRSDILWDALYQIATLLYDLYENDEIKLVEQAFNSKSKLELARGEGTMTRKDSKLMRQYIDVYQGKEIDIESHIKTNENNENSNKFLRIYFCYNSSAHKIIIGSCGKHFNNYTTRKIK